MNCSVCEEHEYACRLSKDHNIICCECDEIINMVAEFFSYPKGKVNRDSYIEALAADSLQSVELFLDIEDRFKI